MNDHVILGIHISNRTQHAGEVQNVLSECGHAIKTRIGLHDVEGGRCTPGGLILLEMHGEQKTIESLLARLQGIEGVQVQQMLFKH